jgi:creatinine amidohydrolase/Fe(II)-dependent formamide hydrolase-like protein
MDKFLIEEMTWEEARDRFKETDIAILPVGSVEQHGLHLPLSTDAFDAYWLAKEVAKRVVSPKPIVLLPINYGISYHHMNFPGTISISPETLIATIYEIGCALLIHGIKKLLIINRHGGNVSAIKCASQKLKYEKKLFVFIDTGEIASKEREEIIKTQNDIHSGEDETSTSLANREALVKLDKLTKRVPKFSSQYLGFTGVNKIPATFSVDELSSTGVIGDATLATKSKGKKLWQAHIKNLVEFIEQLKNL